VWLTLFFGAVLSVGCRSPSALAASPALIAQWSGQRGVQTAGTRVLRTAGDWESFWKQVGQDQPRALDVANEMAVLISLGERRTGGFAVEVLRAGPQDQKLVVEYRETKPAPDMMVIQALTYPWVIAVLPRTDLPVELRDVAPIPGTRAKE
jgi:hypothetical protein